EKAEVGLERRKAALEKQIANCTEAIAGGQVLRSLTDKIAVLERELADVEQKIAASQPMAVRLQLRDTRRFVESRLQDLGAVLNAEPRAAREAIAKHVTKITLTPEGKTYIAKGTWDLLGWWRITWCRGPESNWLRPPFQGGALPMSYPGLCAVLRIVGTPRCGVKFRSCSLSTWFIPSAVGCYLSLLLPIRIRRTQSPLARFSNIPELKTTSTELLK